MRAAQLQIETAGGCAGNSAKALRGSVNGAYPSETGLVAAQDYLSRRWVYPPRSAGSDTIFRAVGAFRRNRAFPADPARYDCREDFQTSGCAFRKFTLTGTGMSTETDEEGDWDAIERGIRMDGFAASEYDRLRPAIIASLGGWFEAVRRLNRFAMRCYLTATTGLPGRKISDPFARGTQLFSRCLGNFQAALILMEYGAGQEALVHVRTIYEAGFWIGFLANEPEQAEAQLRLRAENSRRRHLQAVLDASEHVNSETRQAALDAIRLTDKKSKQGREIDLATVARRGQSAFEYLHYAELSDSAAHASLSSIFHHLSRDEDGTYNGHQLGPNEAANEKAVRLAAHAMMSALGHLVNLTRIEIDVSENIALNDQFDSLDRLRNA